MNTYSSLLKSVCIKPIASQKAWEQVQTRCRGFRGHPFMNTISSIPKPHGNPTLIHRPWGWVIDLEKPRWWGILTETPWGFDGGFTWFLCFSDGRGQT